MVPYKERVPQDYRAPSVEIKIIGVGFRWSEKRFEEKYPKIERTDLAC